MRSSPSKTPGANLTSTETCMTNSAPESHRQRNMLCHTRAGAWVKVHLCLLLQVGLLKCRFPSGSLIALVELDSEMGMGLLNGHLLVGLLSGGGGGTRGRWLSWDPTSHFTVVMTVCTHQFSTSMANSCCRQGCRMPTSAFCFVCQTCGCASVGLCAVDPCPAPTLCCPTQQ